MQSCGRRRSSNARLAAAAGLAGCVVLVRESSEAVAALGRTHDDHQRAGDVREHHGDRVVAVEGGTAAGTVSSSAAVTDPAQLADVVRGRPRLAARGAGPAEDAMPLLEPDGTDATGTRPAAATTIGVFEKLAAGLSRRVRRPAPALRVRHARADDEWLGTSTGIRRRWVQPTGSVELNVKTRRPVLLGVDGRVDGRLHRRGRRGAGRGRRAPARLGRAQGRAARRPVRDDPAAVGGRRPDDLPGVVHGVAGRRRRGRAPSPGRTGPGSASGSPPCR